MKFGVYPHIKEIGKFLHINSKRDLQKCLLNFEENIGNYLKLVYDGYLIINKASKEDKIETRY